MEYVGLARLILSFVFVLALMLGIAWLARRFKLDEKLQARKKRQGDLFVQESLYLDPRRRLAVVGHGRQRYLLLLSAGGDVNLGPLPPEEESTDAPS